MSSNLDDKIEASLIVKKVKSKKKITKKKSLFDLK